MNDKKIVVLNLDDVLPNRFQPRIRFDEQATLELASSIKEHGIIQPIVVRPVADKYEIIAGERRYKASILAGLKQIPAIVTELNDRDSAEIALIENVQRQELTPIEEAISYRKILDMGYITQEQLASKIGCTQSTIANKLRLLNLEDEVQEALLDGLISERHARSLLKLENKDMQIKMLDRIVNERLTVRKTDEEIKNMLDNESKIEVNEVEDVEILDFDEEPEKAGEPVMEVTPLKTQEEIENMVKLSAISRNAEDIYTEEKSVNTEALLKSDNSVSEDKAPTSNYTVVEEKKVTPPTEGRFFNIFEPDIETQPTQMLDEVGNTPTNIFENQSINNQNILGSEEKFDDKLFSSQPQEETIDNSFIDIKLDNDINLNNASINEIKKPDVLQVSNNQITSMKDVIGAIRNCADMIENNGFTIDVEEIDFEDMYQVIFKVNKK